MSIKTAARLNQDYQGGESVWTFINTRRVKHNAINHGQGFPNWASPDFVKKACQEAISEDYNQYAPNTGHPSLRKELLKLYSDRIDNKLQLSVDNFQVSNGCAGALDGVFQAFIDRGDEVIAIEPSFDFYKVQLSHAGGTLRFAPLDLGTAKDGSALWTFDPKRIIPLINENTKILLLNTPHNPTGYVMSLSTMKAIADIISKFPKILIVMDEVYEKITFDGCDHHYFAKLAIDCGLFNRTITCSSAAKTFSVTGWKMGWAFGPKHLIKAVNFVTRGQTWCQPTPLQEAMARILRQARLPYQNFNSYYEWLEDMYAKKRDKICNAIRASGMKPIVPKGSFFICADASELIEKKFGKIGDTSRLDLTQPHTFPDWKFAEFLVCDPRLRIATIPMSAFVGDETKRRNPRSFHYIRFSFCVSDEALDESARRLKQLPQILNSAVQPSKL